MDATSNMNRIGFYCWDITNDKFYMDDVCAHIFGVSLEQAKKGISIFNILEKIDLADRNRVIEAALTTLKTGSFYLQEYGVRRENGSLSRVRTVGRYLVDEENVPFKRLGTMEEISPPVLRH
ncbi:PAS domain-containing protein [Agrobacterium tumefaciens]|uniref:PAS domain-containing protein n=1 Tax=Agrobacterium tumefaciens TaxID=358 RepID=UPI00287C06FD|nr:PAS domain-containing protein [Agrobacterium tumefaciens]MDS7594205.1 PAS domain-containing protein [Agrobacterium tumefaciens]